MLDQDIIEGIQRNPRWHYEFDLRGHLTPIHNPTRINRHVQRKSYFFDPMVDLFGGSLKGKRVLDLGCNAGFWSLAAIEAGCEFVLGVDGRPAHVEQANFVFQVKSVDKSRYRFLSANVFDLDFNKYGDFDVVLFLGLLYHIAKPIVLLEKISAVNNDLLIIDTRISEYRGAIFEIIHEGVKDPRNAVEYGIALRPSRQAVIDIAELVGYRVSALRPQFTDYTGAPDYEVGLRRAFLCSKLSDLSNLSVPTEKK